MAAPFSRVLLTRLLSRLNDYALPVWTVAPTVTGADAGSLLTYTNGTVTGYPEPTVTYRVLVDDVDAGAVPYTVQQSDVGKTLKVRGRAINNLAPAGVAQDSAGFIATGSIRASISATGQWLDENGDPLVLRGVNQGTWDENFEPDAAAIKARGANVVRLVGVRWWGDDYGDGVDAYSSNPADDYIDPAHRAQMLEEVGWLQAQGIWIGFVFDSDNGAGKRGLGAGQPNFFEESAEGATKLAEWKVMCRSVAQDLLAYDRILYFEPIAEPLQHDSNSTHNEVVRNVYRSLMDNIRQVDTRTPFLIGPRASYGANFITDVILPERNDYGVTCDYLTGKVSGEGTIAGFTESLRSLRQTYNVGLFQQQVGRETIDDIGDVNNDDVGDTSDNVGFTAMCGVMSQLNAHNIPYTWWQWHQNTDNPDTYALHYKITYPGPSGPDNWVPKTAELAVFEYHMRQTGDWVEDEAIAAATSVPGGLLFDPAPSNCFTDAAGTIPAAVGQKVLRINAVVGDGYASQSSSALAPTLVATVNGYALQFSSAAGTYLNINTPYFASGDSAVVIAAGRPTASGSARVMFHCGNSQTTVRNPYLAITSADVITAAWRGDDNVNRASDSVTTCDGRAIVATAYRSGSSKKVNAQGVQEGSNANAVGSMANITRARWGSSSTGANNFDGPMSLLFLGKGLNDAQCHAIERRGAWKEGAPFRAAIPVLSIVGATVLTATNGRPYTGFTGYGFNGVQPYSYSLVGTWPTGLSINASTGAITGTPSQTGSFTSLSVRVTDDNDDTADLSTFTLTVAAAVGISGTPVTTATNGRAYTGFTASASGGTAPITYALVGTWPTGVSVNSSTGAVTGTPTQTGSFTSLSVSATDVYGSTASLNTFTMTVAAAVGISGTPVLTATNGRAYTGFTASASGGTAPIVYAKVGAWPTGLTLNTSTGEVSGTPSQSGSFAGMSISATDAYGSTASLSTFTLVVAAAVGVSGTPVLTATEDEAYAGFDVDSTGGTAPITFALTGTWPTGISINSSTGVVSGTPTEFGTFPSLSVSATDTYGSAASLATFTLTVEVASGTDTWGSLELLSANTGPTLEYTTRMWVNLLNMGRACWCPTSDSSGFGYSSVSLKANGYPASGTTSTRVFMANVTDWDAGNYLFECVGDLSGGGLQNVGVGSFTSGPTYNSGTSKTTATLNVPTGQDGTGTIALRFNNVPSNFGAVIFNAPGYALNTTQKIRTEFVTHMAPFKCMRFMDQLNTNGPDAAFAGGGNQDTNWTGSYAASAGHPLYHQNSLAASFEISEACGASIVWTNIPAKATDAYISSYVADGAARREVGTLWLIEFGNELWNGSLGESTAYADIRTAAFTAASVRAGADLTSITRTSNVITAVFDAAHGLTTGASIYVRHKTGAFTEGNEVVTVTDSTTLTWADNGSDGSITHADDDTFIFLNPTHTLCAPMESYYEPENPTANYVRIRYMLQRAKAIYDAIDAANETANIKVMLGVWMASTFNYVPAIAWAVEEYGDVDWLYAMPPAMYMEPATPNSITSTTQVFTQLDANATDVTLPNATRWNNLMCTWGMKALGYEFGPHTHTADADSDDYILAAHSDDRMRQRLKSWSQSWLNRGGEYLCFFHAGVAEAPTTPNATWPITYGDYTDDATSVKYAAFSELEGEAAVAAAEAGINSGTIRYIDVMPESGAFLGQVSNWLVIRPEKSVPDISIFVAANAPGTYTLAIDAARHTDAAVAYTASVNGAQVSSGNLPSVNVFTTEPTQAFSTSVTLNQGINVVTFHVANASRADWVGLYRVRVT